MPIQQIGGRNVYVITGSNKDPRLTSTGQSWANLVTQQKYMLFQEAQKQALREAQLEEADFQTQARIVQEQRKALQREIDFNRKVITDLQAKQLTENARRERDNQREANKGVLASQRASSSGGGGGGRVPIQKTPNKGDVTDYYRRLIQDEQKIVDSIKTEIFRLEKAKDGKTRREKQAYDKQLEPLYDNLRNAESDRDRLKTDLDDLIEKYGSEEFNQKYRELFGVKTGGQTRPSAPKQTTQQTDAASAEIQQLEPISYDVSPYESEIDRLTTKLEALEMPTRREQDVIQRQSEIYQEKFGRGRGAQPVDRQVEMDVLGVQPEPEPIVEEPQPEPTPIVEEVQPEPVVEEPQPRQYTVQRGDTLGEISQEMYGTPSRYMDIAEASGIQDPDVIREGQELTVPPSPTPTLSDNREALNRIRALRMRPERLANIGRRMSIEDMMVQEPTVQEVPSIKQKFESVANQHPNQKKLLAINLLQQYAQEMGVSSPEYAKVKVQVLQQLQRSLDPKKARNLKKVRKNQDESPGNYYNLGSMVSGVNEDSRRLVASLFPVSDDTRADEIERLYKNAQQQIKLSVQNKSQKRKALELLDLQYLAVLEDKR